MLNLYLRNENSNVALVVGFWGCPLYWPQNNYFRVFGPFVDNVFHTEKIDPNRCTHLLNRRTQIILLSDHTVYSYQTYCIY